MRKEKELMVLLRGLVDLLAEEASRNPAFADKLEHLMTPVPTRKNAERAKRKSVSVHVPDLHAELTARGEAEFRLWLRDLSVPVLRALIRANDFDPVRRTSKWREGEKLATFIADGLRARMARGSAFIGRRAEAGDDR
jgi:hypothetical protein